MKTTEKWRQITEYKEFVFDGKYEVSNWGRIRNRETLKVLSPYSNQHGQGYLKIKLFDINGKRRGIYIHQIVAFYYLGENQNGYDVDHIDGNVKNNSFSNLRYLSHAENCRAYHQARKAV